MFGLIIFLIDGLIAVGVFDSIKRAIAWCKLWFDKISLAKALPLVILGLVAIFAISSPNHAFAQPQIQSQSAANIAELRNGVRMAYIITHESKNDEITKNGLNELKTALNNRTSVRASSLIGIDPLILEPIRNDIALYPIIYWRLGDNPMPLNIAAQQALNQYMRNGGLLFVDTRGAGLNPNQARTNTQIALRGLVIPPLAQVGQDHVLSKSFYLLAGFPGRYGNAKLWAQNSASIETSANDGVSPIIIGDGDFAFAWANNTNSQNAAINAGINIYLYALTGQYKADQVHIPVILERLKKRRTQ